MPLLLRPLLPVFSRVVKKDIGISLREIAYARLIHPPDTLRFLP